MGKRLFVGNLPFSTSSEDLKELFSEVGTCDTAKVVTDRDTGRSRGFGFVEMSTDDEAKAAVEQLNGRQMGGRQINVDEAHDRPSRPARPGGGRSNRY